MGICFALFGLTNKIQNKNLLIACVLANRAFQGMCSATMQTTCYAIATVEFPKKKSLIVGLVEAMTGVGLIIGPVAGSLLYSAFGFEKCFYILGAFIAVMSICFYLMYPERENNDSAQELDEISNNSFTRVQATATQAYASNIGAGSKLDHSFEMSEEECSDFSDGEIAEEDRVQYG